MEETIEKIKQKYAALGENPESYMKGLYHAKPITYWDYIQVETLLSLQRPRTDFKDEFIFIVYHQITELVLRLMVHELEQITAGEITTADELTLRIKRLNRYTGLLSNSFDIMAEGMSYEDYNQFRMSLTPASGFQCAQFRFVELMCTDLDNLINDRAKSRMPANLDLREKFNYVYWQDAGRNHETGKKSATLGLFEQKYLDAFVERARKMENNNLNQRLKDFDLENNTELRETLRLFDRLYNIEWPVIHLKTAGSYLNKKGEKKAATGGSNWQKYLHPAYQRRVFFPTLWSAQELADWGKEYLESE